MAKLLDKFDKFCKSCWLTSFLSPAPTYSMWTDGSTNSHTNFAADSGLEADHCCIKVEIVTTKKMISILMIRRVEQVGGEDPAPRFCTGFVSLASLGNFLQIQELWLLR